MKLFFFLVYIISLTSIAFSQSVFNSISSIYMADSISRQDSLHTEPDLVKLVIAISPNDTGHVKITLIQKSKIKIIGKNAYVKEPITPDTVSVFEEPVCLSLSLGNYDINIIKNGFKSYSGKFTFNEYEKYLPIELTSISYLNKKQKQWNEYKWISAGATVLSGLLAYYFKSRIHLKENEYNHSTTIGSTVDNRNSILSYQDYYIISSAISFTAIGGFIVSWLLETFYYGY